MAKTRWVDYRKIKAEVSLTAVLDKYGILEGMKKSGINLTGCCPIHGGSNPRQFSLNPEKNIFNCFGNCKSGGNVLDFVSRMEKVSLREAGLLLQEWFGLDGDATRKGKKKEARVPEKSEKPKQKEKKEDTEPVNPPLSFKLKTLEYRHRFFEEREIDRETIKHFGLGFCSKGIMKGRIAIPIHNELEELVAYCGRATTEAQIQEEGKYKLPPKFMKSHVVYNLNRLNGNVSTLILVESFLSVFTLYQAGIKNVVALMGSVLSEEQEKLILSQVGRGGSLVLMFDPDDSGRSCATDCLVRFAYKRFVRIIDLTEYDDKPHNLNPNQIKEIFQGILL